MDDTDGLVPALKGAADELYATVRIVDADDWDHGDAKGVCPTHWPSSAVATSAVSTPSNDTRTKRPSVRTRRSTTSRRSRRRFRICSKVNRKSPDSTSSRRRQSNCDSRYASGPVLIETRTQTGSSTPGRPRQRPAKTAHPRRCPSARPLRRRRVGPRDRPDRCRLP